MCQAPSLSSSSWQPQLTSPLGKTIQKWVRPLTLPSKASSLPAAYSSSVCQPKGHISPPFEANMSLCQQKSGPLTCLGTCDSTSPFMSDFISDIQSSFTLTACLLLGERGVLWVWDFFFTLPSILTRGGYKTAWWKSPAIAACTRSSPRARNEDYLLDLMRVAVKTAF